jgi:hypothetical protein
LDEDVFASLRMRNGAFCVTDTDEGQVCDLIGTANWGFCDCGVENIVALTCCTGKSGFARKLGIMPMFSSNTKTKPPDPSSPMNFSNQELPA